MKKGSEEFFLTMYEHEPIDETRGYRGNVQWILSNRSSTQSL